MFFGDMKSLRAQRCTHGNLSKNAAKFALLSILCFMSGFSSQATDKDQLVYIGTYTGARSKGIYVSHFDPRAGKLSTPELAAETKNPSFLAVHPNQHVLYCVGEVDEFDGKKGGTVSAFNIDLTTGKLTLINQKSSGGPVPCHLM